MGEETLINAVLLQKTFELIASGKAQYATQLRLGDIADLVLFKGEGFQSAT